ncbi:MULTISPECIES: phosphate ABC transporter substrate-binding/OmpA family protein [unclassified Pseudomonas]|uniref:phosphate ABC transporter substrate-binding/OmpA family protein n=1 Tax=unclassified Pseudomonas TaxID=196821 RepID=UPI002AC8E438|nr:MULTISPECIES: phosphate ABC transporter substrate-binding/OmpA family protein [unclassified Pseudomonas]MEB0040583.1 phosphate ABC transporter substrate-binding/OmpA family protein [Pseudomonas sp. MH10]MEB0079539.1 phosphate ABC transporter substrate-binding/OmpA family protein [Pseudomonas sp. MH10out]MEB0091330.1 phosphate ABC transporter substrate-binding/OmpA family protein [Pseudomonas sp. CCI4.2]MEB0101204.1 phosphate ABC transporter substrate-binding/OmpA family protein [Pseudomonas 
MLCALFTGQSRQRAAGLFFGLLCSALPASVFAALLVPADGGAALRIQGSNTIGATLGPALVEGLLQAQGMQEVRIEPGAHENEQRVTAVTADGHRVLIEVAAHGSGTGFSALKAGTADLAASSRPIKETELNDLAALGDLKSSNAEQVIAIDGVAVILHPGNPLHQLNTEQLARIFSGEVHRWEELGGTGGAIHLYARDDQSGTFDTFNELVLVKNGKTLAPSAKRFESSEQLSDEVSQDRGGIGFIGLPYVRKAQAVAIVDGNSKPMLPTNSLIATEDYPLSRRLYFYLPPLSNQPWAKALVQFAQSAKGQAIVANSGFISQTVQAVKVQVSAEMPADYQAIVRQAQRLSVNFRFAQGSAILDNKAQRDLRRVLVYLKAHNKLNDEVTLVGFGDPKSDSARAALLSKLRAMAVRRELVKNGVNFRDIRGFGDEMPVAANNADEGRIKNRRVEVWVY